MRRSTPPRPRRDRRGRPRRPSMRRSPPRRRVHRCSCPRRRGTSSGSSLRFPPCPCPQILRKKFVALNPCRRLPVHHHLPFERDHVALGDGPPVGDDLLPHFEIVEVRTLVGYHAPLLLPLYPISSFAMRIRRISEVPAPISINLA